MGYRSEHDELLRLLNVEFNDHLDDFTILYPLQLQMNNGYNDQLIRTILNNVIDGLTEFASGNNKTLDVKMNGWVYKIKFEENIYLAKRKSPKVIKTPEDLENLTP